MVAYAIHTTHPLHTHTHRPMINLFKAMGFTVRRCVSVCVFVCVCVWVCVCVFFSVLVC